MADMMSQAFCGAHRRLTRSETRRRTWWRISRPPLCMGLDDELVLQNAAGGKPHLRCLELTDFGAMDDAECTRWAWWRGKPAGPGSESAGKEGSPIMETARPVPAVEDTGEWFRLAYRTSRPYLYCAALYSGP